MLRYICLVKDVWGRKEEKGCLLSFFWEEQEPGHRHRSKVALAHKCRSWHSADSSGRCSNRSIRDERVLPTSCMPPLLHLCRICGT